MLTRGEIIQILKRDIYATPGKSRRIAHVNGIETAAEATAERLTRAHLMSEFVGLSGGSNFVYTVPDKDGRSFRVAVEPSRVWCWEYDNPAICSDSNEGTTCDHAEAVKLHLERERG